MIDIPATPQASMIAPEIIARLKAAVGPNGYLDRPDDIAPYTKSWRGNWQGASPLLLRPATAAEMASRLA